MCGRSLLVLAVLACVVLAGCGGGSGDGEQSPTTDDRLVTSGEHVPIDEIDLPPGAGSDSIENASALLAAHRSVLEETDYSKNVRRFENGPEGYVNVSYTATSSIADEEALYRVNSSVITGEGEQLRRTVEFDDGDTYYRQLTVGSEVTYKGGELPPFREVHTNVDGSVRRAIHGAEFGNPNAFEADGHEYVEYEVTGYEFEDGNRSVSDVDGGLVVRGDGLVTTFSVKVQTERGVYLIEQWYPTVGDVTIEEPEWTDRASAEST